jgi:outer membrane lipoprotein-sorting protein
MSELGDLLELIHSAHQSFTTVSGVLRTWRDSDLGKAAMRELHERETAAGSSSDLLVLFRSGPEETPNEVVERIRFWYERPDRIREEYESDHPAGRNGRKAVRDGRHWWSYDAHNGAITNAGAPDVGSGVGEEIKRLLDPSDVLGVCDLEILGEGDVGGRRGIRVRATNRPTEDHFLRRIPPMGDELEYVFDAERGIALRQAVLIHGDAFSITELEELLFDATIPSETFVLTLPEGESFVSVGDDLALDHVSIQEAARRASFRLFVVARLPEGEWQMIVTYVRPRERPVRTESVHITYMREDAQQHLSLTERPADRERDPDFSEELFGEGVEEVSRDGTRYRVRRGDADLFGPPTMLQFEREGTTIHLQSQELDVEALVGLAAELVEPR